MSEDRTLDEILAEFSTEKPPIEQALETMDGAQFQKVVDAVVAEHGKRAPIKMSELNDREFNELKSRYGF